MELGAWLGLLAAVPLYLAYRAGKTYIQRLRHERQQALQMADLHLATIEALSAAIDAKDQTAPTHLHRVQIYATGLARALALPEAEIQGLRTAVLLHDIGKLAVPEHILAKPGPLTQEEFQKVQVHPRAAADILARVRFPYPVVPIILSHHERWDGAGYPHGLKANEIPLAARILAVADAYESLTSTRPYHLPMAADAAASLLRQEAGKALDPNAVEMFLRELPALRAEIVRLESRAGAGNSTNESGRPSIPSSVFDDIALAHREIYGLYEIAQAMGTSLGVKDTMALIAPKLGNLVPFSACTLFLHDEAADVLQCRFAVGTDEGLLEQLTVRGGQGLNGWVARNRRPLVNAKPDTEFEAGGIVGASALRSALVCPLVYNDRLIGTLAVYHVEPGFYRDDHRRLLDRICAQAAAVINNSIVHERTHQESLTDPMTGLPNSRFMILHLARELARADRLHSEVSMIVMDLDDFKDINDTYGHYAGDRALREVAAVLRTAIRPYDICVRYAGDEFIVVLSGCSRDEAEQKRLELQSAVARVRFEASPEQFIPLTISAGAAVFPHDGRTYETLLARADARMYRDKGQRKARQVRSSA